MGKSWRSENLVTGWSMTLSPIYLRAFLKRLISSRNGCRVAVFFILAVLSGSSYFSFAGTTGTQATIKSLQGGVKEIWPEKSSLLLETDEGDVTIVVPKQARIFRGVDIVVFSDIKKEDELVIRYYDDEAGEKKVLSIVLEG